MSDGKDNFTPDELAKHLCKIARDHGATITFLEFDTYFEYIHGEHSYRIDDMASMIGEHQDKKTFKL